MNDAARQLGILSGAARRVEVDRRRDQVIILRLTRPAISAEEMARILQVSPATIRGDLRALRNRLDGARR